MFQNILVSRENNTSYSDLTIKTSKNDVPIVKPKGNMFEEIIGNLVLELTSVEDPSEEKKQHLLKYFINKNTLDTVYLQLIKRIKLEFLNPKNMTKAFQMIKKHFKIHVPSLNTLAQIDHLCSIIITEQTQNHKLFLDSVSHLQKSVNEYVNEHYTQDEKKEFQEQRQKNEKERKSHKRTGDMKIQTSGIDFRKENNNEITPNFYQKRIKYKPVKSLLDMIIFGGQFKKVTKFEDKQAQIDMSISLSEDNPVDTYNKIDHIQSTKRSTPSKPSSDMEEKPRLYSIKESEPISPENFSKLLDLVLNVEGDISDAVSWVIQIFSDLFTKGNFFYSRVYFFELLEGTLQNQIHSFEIIFNIFQIVKEKQKGLQDIFQLFCEMMFFIYKKKSVNNQIWKKVFPMFTYLISDKKFTKKL